MLKRISLPVFFFCLFLVGLFAALPSAQAVEELLPWALRVHYSFSRDNVTLNLDEERALMQLRVGDEQIIAEDLGFAVILGDDSEIRFRDLGKSKTERNLIAKSPLGAAATYDVVFPPKDGLQVTWHMLRSKDRPVSLSHLIVKNVGTTAITIKTLRVLEAPSGSIRQLSPETEVWQRHGSIVGGTPVVADQGEALAMSYHDPKSKASWLIGLSPNGQGQASMNFDAFGETWQGQAESRFSPLAQLKPGDTLNSAEIIMAFGQQPSSNLDMYYA